jgi:nephrocystin-4
VEEMSVDPSDKFMLPSNAVQEMNVAMQILTSGHRQYYLNVVDVDLSYLVRTWLICVNCKPPVVSKSFELTLPVATGMTMAKNVAAQKRVSYTNPYATEKCFYLSTNRDDLLSFNERRLKLAANQQKAMSLKFLPNPIRGFVEIYVFINNENNTNEETFALRVNYINPTVNQNEQVADEDEE